MAYVERVQIDIFLNFEYKIRRINVPKRYAKQSRLLKEHYSPRGSRFATVQQKWKDQRNESGGGEKEQIEEKGEVEEGE